MQIIDVKVLRGPNRWSNYRRKLIEATIDLGKLENYPTNRIKGFRERLEKAIPSLYYHWCSEGEPGGFLQRVEKGTWMGHVMEHVALELQAMAGMDCGYGRTRSQWERGLYHVVFAFEIEKAGLYALDAALRMVETLAREKDYDCAEDIIELTKMRARYGFGPSTQSIITEAEKWNIPITPMANGSHVQLGYGARQKAICASISSGTSSIAVNLASDKENTKMILSRSFIPVPQGILLCEEKDIDKAIEKIGFPFVLKPLNGNQGRGITVNITTKEKALEAWPIANKISEYVIAERFIKGDDYRFLVINYKLVAVARRTPACVTGDGRSTIQQLIDKENEDPSRGDGHENILTKIKVDEITKGILDDHKLQLDLVLEKGKKLFLKRQANISMGGTSEDVTDEVHPQTVMLAERIARIMNLDICGIDVVCTDITKPLTKKTGAVLEVNAAPGFRMHLSPSKGLGKNVAEAVVDMLFPDKKESRIPVVAITGTNGKTTVTRLIAWIAMKAGRSVGYTTTEGIYINKEVCFLGDCSGPESARAVLSDPGVEMAVLECARGGIIRSGLGFDNCSTSIITNISEDHLGLEDVHTLEDLANVKAVVARSTLDSGYAILNAENEYVFNMKNELSCNIALFSMDPKNIHIEQHCQRGGIAAVIEDGYFVIRNNKWRNRVAKVQDVPLTFEGTAAFMMQNILAAMLAAFVERIDLKHITEALKTFIPSHELTPGRMNLFSFSGCKLMIDYVHNKDGYEKMKEYVSAVKASKKTGIISGTGDRRDDDLLDIGRIAGETFDEIIIRHDKDLRGRSKDEITKLLTDGIRETNPDIPIKVISDEFEAIEFAIEHSEKDAFIFETADHVQDTISFVLELQKRNSKTEEVKH